MMIKLYTCCFAYLACWLASPTLAAKTSAYDLVKDILIKQNDISNETKVRHYLKQLKQRGITSKVKSFANGFCRQAKQREHYYRKVGRSYWSPIAKMSLECALFYPGPRQLFQAARSLSYFTSEVSNPQPDRAAHRLAMIKQIQKLLELALSLDQSNAVLTARERNTIKINLACLYQFLDSSRKDTDVRKNISIPINMRQCELLRAALKKR